MSDNPILALTQGYWCTLKLNTATDQHLAINQTTGVLGSFRKNNPNEGDDAKWFKFLIVPRNVNKNQYWLFSQAAQNGSGELVSRLGSSGLGQWGFEDKNDNKDDDEIDNKNAVAKLWQVFQIVPLDTFGGDGKVVIRIVEDDRAISTRWDAATFLWDYEEGDNQQWLHIHRAEVSKMPKVPIIEGEPGQLDRELLKVGGFNQPGANDVVLRKTEPRIVGAQHISFPRVKDDYGMGRKMKETPYYLLTHTCFWRLTKDEEIAAPGKVEKTLTWEIGTSTAREVSVESHLNITVGAKTTYSFPSGGGGEVNFVAEFGQRWQSVNNVERYETESGTDTVSFEKQRARVVVWALVNRYTLTRENGEQIGEMEFIEKDVYITRSYEEPMRCD